MPTSNNQMSNYSHKKIEAVDHSMFRQRLNIARSNGEFADVCLGVDGSGVMFKAHQVVLAAASDILNIQDKFSIKGVSEEDLESILTYIYLGTVQVAAHRLSSFLKAAKALGVYDLQDVEYDAEDDESISIKEESISEVISVSDSEGGPKAKGVQQSANENAKEHGAEAEISEDTGAGCDSDTCREAGMIEVGNEVDIEEANVKVSLETVPEVEENITDSESQILNEEKKDKTYKVDEKFKVTKGGVKLKRFKYKTDVTRHERIHNGKRLYLCKFCQRSFTQKRSLVRHERIHTGEKPYACKLCAKAFTQAGNLQVHERRRHTGHKPHICSVCNKGFVTRNEMKRHWKIHHKITESSSMERSPEHPKFQPQVVLERIDGL